MQKDGNASVIEGYYSQFRLAYSEQNYGVAYLSFMNALTADPHRAYRYFFSRIGGNVCATMDAAGKSREVVAWLDQAMASHPNVNLLCKDDSEIERALQLREANILKNLPSIAVVTAGKAASVVVGNIFSSGFNLPCFVYSIGPLEVVESWAQNFARGGACYTTHLFPLARSISRLKRAGIDKIIVHVRDPRQRILSLIHHVLKYDVNPRLMKNGFAQQSMDERVESMMEPYLHSIAWLQGWVAAEKELNILFSTFEEFVEDREAFVRRYLEYYGAPMDYFKPEEGLKLHDHIDYHFRSGQTEEWRKAFSPDTVDRLSALLPAHLKQRFGWAD